MKKQDILPLNGSFDEIIKASVSGNPTPKKKLTVQDKLKVMQIIHKHLIKKAGEKK